MRNAKKLIAMMIVIAMAAMTLVSCDMSSMVGDLLQDPSIQNAILDEYSSEIDSYIDEYSKNETESKSEKETNKNNSTSDDDWWNSIFGGGNSQTGIGENTEIITIAPPEFETNIGYPEVEEWPEIEEGEFDFELSYDEYGNPYYTLVSVGSWRGKYLNIPAEYDGIPVKKIAYSAFLGARMEYAYIPEGIEEIDMWAFGYCENLRELHIPSTLTYMSERVFTGSANVENLYVNYNGGRYLSYNNCIIDSYNNMLHTAFNCSEIEMTLWDLSIEKIGDDACRSVTSLTYIKIPDSVVSIGNYAFYECYNITRIDIGSSHSNLDEIGVSAFSYCASLEEIYMVGGGNHKYKLGDNCLVDMTNGTLVLGCMNTVIPDDGSILSIGHAAFEGATRLEYIYVPSSVKTIERQAFNGCERLSKVHLPDGLESIGYLAFAGTRRLYNIDIPASAIYIDDEAFRGSGIENGVSNDSDSSSNSGTIVYPGGEIEWSTSIIINGSYSEIFTGSYIEFGSGNGYFEIATGGAYEIVTDEEGNTYYYYHAIAKPTEP